MQEALLFRTLDDTPIIAGPEVGLFYGGYYPSGPLANCDRRNSQGARINLVTNIGTPRHTLAGAKIDSDRALFFGGANEFNQPISHRIVLTSTAVVVVEHVGGVSARRDHAMADVQEGAISYGGRSLNDPSSSYWLNQATSFSNTGTVHVTNTIGEPTTSLGGCSVDKQRGYFYGGSALRNLIRTINWGRISNTTSTTITSFTSGLSGRVGAAVGDTGLFIGTTFQTIHQIVRVSSNLTLKSIELFNGEPRQHAAAANVGPNVVVHGGLGSFNALFTGLYNEAGVRLGNELTLPGTVYAMAGASL